MNLWSYPSPYRDQKLGGAGDGKELCDLLVVCGRHIIIFSEKHIGWTNSEIGIAWRRWFKRAVLNSADQLAGAERWIAEHPDRIFLDKGCTQRFPLDLPSRDERIVHKIIVARGAGDACREYFKGGSGSLAIDMSIAGNDHLNPDDSRLKPFTIGDIDPGTEFTHLLDDASLEIVLGELDTISDFTEYLTKKSAFARSGRLIAAHGEEDLLGYYAVRTNALGEHDFTPPSGGEWRADERIAIDGTHFAALISDARFIAKKEAERRSYVWDTLIQNFTDHMLEGTTLVPDGQQYSLSNSEQAVRFMALENRFMRRTFGEAIDDAMTKSLSVDRFFRVMINSPTGTTPETGYFFFSMKYLNWMEKYGYAHYRLKRQEFISAYAQGILVRYPLLKRVVGIAVEPPRDGRGSSEDLILAIRGEWTDADIAEINARCEKLGILKEGYVENRFHAQEFPDLAPLREKIPPQGKRKFTRRQRKARQSKSN